MIMSNRNQFIGGHVTKPVKDALRQKAASEGVPMSVWLYRLLLRELNVKEDNK